MPSCPGWYAGLAELNGDDCGLYGLYGAGGVKGIPPPKAPGPPLTDGIDGTDGAVGLAGMKGLPWGAYGFVTLDGPKGFPWGAYGFVALYTLRRRGRMLRALLLGVWQALGRSFGVLFVPFTTTMSQLWEMLHGGPLLPALSGIRTPLYLMQ